MTMSFTCTIHGHFHAHPDLTAPPPPPTPVAQCNPLWSVLSRAVTSSPSSRRVARLGAVPCAQLHSRGVRPAWSTHLIRSEWKKGRGEGSRKRTRHICTSVHQPSPRTIIWWIIGWMADLHELQWLKELEKPNSHVTLM